MDRYQLKHRDINASTCIVESCIFCPNKFARDGKNLTKIRGKKLIRYANRGLEDEIRERYNQNRSSYLNIDLHREFRKATVTSNLQSIPDMPFDGSFTLLDNPDVYICYSNAVIHSLCMILPWIRFMGNNQCFLELRCRSNQNHYVEGGGRVVTAIHRLLRMLFSRRDRVKPGPFKKALDKDPIMRQFLGDGQHCALEFFLALTDRIHEATRNDDGVSLTRSLFQIDIEGTIDLRCGNDTCPNTQQTSQQESTTHIALPLFPLTAQSFFISIHA